MSDNIKIPQHVAIIMDGNGRWAKQRGKERFEGHIKGVDSVRTAIQSAKDFGVKYLTLYTFSTENWGRPTEEVEAIMDLLCKSIVNEMPNLIREGVKVKVIGYRARFSEKVKSALQMIEDETKQGEDLTMILGLNYSSRDEICRAVSSIAQRVKNGEIEPEQVTEELISNSLDTAGFPDPDFIIRTSGECRLSNFLMWQASYAEMYFPETLWPDFGKADFEEALKVYTARDRRYGLVK